MARLKELPRTPATELNLQVGEALQITFMDDDTRGQFYVKVVGFLPERRVMVTSAEEGGTRVEVRHGPTPASEDRGKCR